MKEFPEIDKKLAMADVIFEENQRLLTNYMIARRKIEELEKKVEELKAPVA